MGLLSRSVFGHSRHRRCFLLRIVAIAITSDTFRWGLLCKGGVGILSIRGSWARLFVWALRGLILRCGDWSRDVSVLHTCGLREGRLAFSS